MAYEDVSVAFLRVQPLPREREIYMRLLTQYPKEVLDELYHTRPWVKAAGFALPDTLVPQVMSNLQGLGRS